MADQRILVTNAGIHPWLGEKLEKLGFKVDVDFESTKAELEEKLSDYAGVVMKSRFDADKSFLKKGKNLRFVARVGVGFEHIDIRYAKKKGIKVLLSPEGSRDAVGEHTVGLLLSLLNRLHLADRQIRNRQWIREPNRGVELKGKTVGVIGFGNMGKAFAKRVAAFGTKVMAYDKYKEDFSKKYALEVTLNKIFKKSDIISIHIPYNKKNHYFIDEKFLNSFSKPIYLLNTARGKVLDTEALVKAMKDGKVLGAGLDVLEYEAQSFENLSQSGQVPAPLQYLLDSEQVVLSPHIAGWTQESKLKHAKTIVKKIQEVFA